MDERVIKAGYYAMMQVFRERYQKPDALIAPWETVEPTQQRALVAFAEAVAAALQADDACRAEAFEVLTEISAAVGMEISRVGSLRSIATEVRMRLSAP